MLMGNPSPIKYSAKTSKPYLTAICREDLLQLSVNEYRSFLEALPIVNMNYLIFMRRIVPFRCHPLGKVARKVEDLN